MAKSKFETDLFMDDKKNPPPTTKKCYVIIAIVLIVAIVTFIVGVVLLQNEPSCAKETSKPKRAKTFGIKDMNEYCESSQEAKRIKLQEFLQKCQTLYFVMYPHEEIIFISNANQDTINEVARK